MVRGPAPRVPDSAAPGGRTSADLERLLGGDSLCLQSSVDLHSALRVGADVTAGVTDDLPIWGISICTRSDIAITRFMTSRAGFAWHNEYSWVRQQGTAPDGSDLTSSSLLLGFDFDF